MTTGWLDAVDYFRTTEFEQTLQGFDDVRYKYIIPSRNDVFRAFRTTPFDSVKVVILGQDPYPNREHAMGLAFSVPAGTKRLPKSLINIFTELEKDTGIHRTNGDLTDWTQQGVFLLNTALTLEEGKSGSHASLWQHLTDAVIRALSEQRTNLVFVLWGHRAIKKARLIDDEKHMVIASVHPSPLSAHRGFHGSMPFSRINNYLQSQNIPTISW